MNYSGRTTPPLSPEVLARSRSVGRAQRQRESDLIKADREARKGETARRNAVFAVENGNIGALNDSKLGPTPELLSKAVFDQFAVDTMKGYAHSTTTLKRRDVPVAAKMRMSGIIDNEGYQACVWFRTTWEKSGLLGNISSTDYNREIFSFPDPCSTRAQMTPYQMEIADCIRFIAREMSSRHARLLYATVIEDIPLQRAIRLARAFHRHPKEGFQDAVKQLVDAKRDFEKA